MRIRAGLYLIPDVAVFQAVRPASVPENPPLIASETLSPDDRLQIVGDKLEEYRAWGVPNAWAVELREVDELPIPELGITLAKSDIFD